MNRLIRTVAVLAIMIPVTAVAEAEQRQISVTGEGRIEAVPDMATITLGVTHQAKEAGDAMDATSTGVSNILERLETLGIESRDVQTQRFSLNPVWSNRRSTDQKEPRITGFVASNMVVVRVRDLDRLGQLLDSVIADGANDFNGLQFGLQEPRPLLDAARAKAVADGVAKAELLAKAAGVTLGPVMSISEHGGSSPRPMAMEMAAARDASVPIAAGEITMGASVSMVFRIAD